MGLMTRWVWTAAIVGFAVGCGVGIDQGQPDHLDDEDGTEVLLDGQSRQELKATSCFEECEAHGCRREGQCPCTGIVIDCHYEQTYPYSPHCYCDYSHCPICT